MKKLLLLAPLFFLIACKKSSSSNSQNQTVSPEVAKVVGLFYITSFVDGATGQSYVYTPQNSPGTITVTKTDATHFHFVLTETSSTSSADYVFYQITGDGYVHFNEVSGKNTARYVNSVGGLTIESTTTPYTSLVALRNP